jgi:hypothetical protein
MSPDEIQPGVFYISRSNNVYLGTIDKSAVHLKTGNYIPPPMHAKDRAWTFLQVALVDEVARFLTCCPGANIRSRTPNPCTPAMKTRRHSRHE